MQISVTLHSIYPFSIEYLLMESKAISNAVLSKKDTASSTYRTHCLRNQICNEKK